MWNNNINIYSDFVVLAYKMKIDTLMFMNGQIVLSFINDAKI